jgi:hypothetical protein
MRNVKNITVAVSVDLYRQTRRLAAEYDTTVTAMVAYLLQRLPDALKRAQFPVGGPKWAPATRPNQSAAAPDPDTPTPPDFACKTVNPDLSRILSTISGLGLRAHAAAVSQYADANQHRNNDLPASRIRAGKR